MSFVDDILKQAEDKKPRSKQKKQKQTQRNGGNKVRKDARKYEKSRDMEQRKDYSNHHHGHKEDNDKNALDRIMDETTADEVADRVVDAAMSTMDDIIKEEISQRVETNQLPVEEEVYWEEEVDTETGRIISDDEEDDEVTEEVRGKDMIPGELYKAVLPPLYIAGDSLQIGDPYLGYTSFPIIRKGIDIDFDPDTVGDLLVTALYITVMGLTPYAVVQKKELNRVMLEMGVKNYDNSSFLVIDPYKGFDNSGDMRVFCYYVSDDLKTLWSNTMQYMIGENDGVLGRAVMCVADIIAEFYENTFLNSITDAQYEKFLLRQPHSEADFVREIVSSKHTSFFTDDNDVPINGDEYYDELYLDNNCRDQYLDAVDANDLYEAIMQKEGALNDNIPFRRARLRLWGRHQGFVEESKREYKKEEKEEREETSEKKEGQTQSQKEKTNYELGEETKEASEEIGEATDFDAIADEIEASLKEKGSRN